jgi:hypothetical protein
MVSAFVARVAPAGGPTAAVTTPLLATMRLLKSVFSASSSPAIPSNLLLRPTLSMMLW